MKYVFVSLIAIVSFFAGWSFCKFTSENFFSGDNQRERDNEMQAAEKKAKIVAKTISNDPNTQKKIITLHTIELLCNPDYEPDSACLLKYRMLKHPMEKAHTELKRGMSKDEIISIMGYPIFATQYYWAYETQNNFGAILELEFDSNQKYVSWETIIPGDNSTSNASSYRENNTLIEMQEDYEESNNKRLQEYEQTTAFRNINYYLQEISNQMREESFRSTYKYPEAPLNTSPYYNQQLDEVNTNLRQIDQTMRRNEMMRRNGL